MTKKTTLLLILMMFLFAGRSSRVSAYFTNMPASVVVGQNDFTSSATGTSASKLSSLSRGIFVDPRGRLIVADYNNNRVLIWNTVPTENGVAADLVLGQANFSGTSANRGGSMNSNTLNQPLAVFSDGDRLFVADEFNDRVLLWNTFPTSNGQPADVVIGQSQFTSKTNTCNALNFSAPTGLSVFNNHLIVSDRNHRRAMIWNSVPTQNGVNADVVLGQANMTTCTAPTQSQTSLNSPRGLSVDGQGRLLIADASSSNRVMVWNAFPSTNNAPADVVIGQASFTGTAAQTTASGLNIPTGVYSSGNRVFIADQGNARVLIYNSIPTSNGASADIVIGQPNFTSSSANAGGTTSANGLNSGQVVFENNNKLFIADNNNSRILIFTNLVQQPTLTLDSNPTSVANNQLEFTGSAYATAPYSIKSVEYAINGGSFQAADAVDGQFDSNSERFKFRFDPMNSESKDTNGESISGYTIQLKSVNTNADTTDHLFVFSPFILNGPNDNSTVSDSYPTFDFSVSKQRQILKENLDHFAIQIKDRRNNTGWQTLIDQIPVDFESHKGDLQNLQHAQWEQLGTLNGQYETANFIATYTDQGARISVKSKVTALAGNYEWKVLAIDKSGQSQETGSRQLIAVGSLGSISPGFPLAILNISGLGNPNISSYNVLGIKSTYRTTSLSPTFYGIAWSGARVNVQLTEQKCSTACTQDFSTSANALSRFGINVPTGSLKRGKSYTTSVSVQLNDLFTQLPAFTLQVQ